MNGWPQVFLATVGMGCITYLEAQAIKAGIDGTAFAAAIAAIAGLGGYVLHSLTAPKT